MSGVASDIGQYVLRPTPEEVRETRVLYHSYDLSHVLEALPKIASLRALGLSVTTLTDPELLMHKLDFDFLFKTQFDEPFAGHELLTPALAAYQGIPALGPPAPVRALSEDKVLGKMMAASAGVEVARHQVINPRRQPGLSNLYPPGRWILKPRSGVMSEQIGFVDDAASWRKAIARASHPMHGGRDFLVEEFVPGLNLAVPVVDGLPPLAAFLEQGEARNNILTKSGKEGLTPDYRSDPYDGPGAAQARAAAARMAATITPFDYARFDFRFEPVSNRLVFLEVNIICAIGLYSVVTQAAALHGIDHATLIGHVFTHSLRRQRKPA
jgi:D-alanine-D-alanine ligase